MIQDIFPHEFNNSYKNASPKDGDILIVEKDRKLLAKISDGTLVLPRYSCNDDTELETYLFAVDEVQFFRTSATLEEVLVVQGFKYYPQGLLMNLAPEHLAYGALVAIDLCSWYDNNIFCGRCAGRTVKDLKERMLYCPKCNNQIYPRINPVVIVAVTNGDKVLLTRYKGITDPNRYALVAGFAEIGESIEDAARREVFEETGVKIKNIRFYKSQPWPMSGSVLFGLFCDLDGSDSIKIQEDELSYAEWIRRGDIPLRDNTAALTADMINCFLTGNYPE